MLGGLVDCTSDDLEEENESLRLELQTLKTHLSKLVEEHGALELINIVTGELSLRVEADRLQEELGRLKKENAMLEKFNKEQSRIGKMMSEEKVALLQSVQSFKVDLLRIMPLQCEKEKFRKLSEETSSSLRQALSEQASLAAEAEMLRDTVGEQKVSMANLQAINSDRTLEVARLTTELHLAVCQLETETEARIKVEATLSDYSAIQQKSKSQSKELERTLAAIEHSKQEVLVLKSRLLLRDEALRESLHQNPGSTPPITPPIFVISPQKPRRRREHRATDRTTVLECQGPTSPDFAAQCNGIPIDEFAAGILDDMPSCMPVFPAWIPFTQRKTD